MGVKRTSKFQGAAEGRPERYTEIATEFVRLNVDVIVTTGDAVLALKQATAIIPIVFVLSNDPIGSGLVSNLARPGGNVTGLSVQATDLAGKRLELLREVVPHLRRLAILADVGYPDAVLEMGNVQATARALGLEVSSLKIRQAEDIVLAFAAIKPGRTLRGGQCAQHGQPYAHHHARTRRAAADNL